MSELENVTRDEVNLVMNEVYEFAMGTSYTEEWRMTRRLFSMIANLPNDLDEGRLALADAAGLEWSVFDVSGGASIRRFALLRDYLLDERARSILSQIAESQRYSDFAIVGSQPGEARLDLIDLESGRSIVLRDPRASRVCTGYEPWTSLNMRLAEVGGSWFRVGMTMFHNRTAVGPDDVGRLGGLYITDIVRETIGIGASCAESVAPVSILGGPELDGRTDEGPRRPFDTLR